MIKNGFHKANIFYQNIEPHNPENLSDDVIGELNYFKQYLDKAIDSLDVKRYGMEWKEDELLTYRIFPNSTIKFEIPKKRILIKIKHGSYNQDVPILNSNYLPVRCRFIEETNTGVILELEQAVEIDVNEELSFGRDIIEWELISVTIPDKITELSDGNRTFKVIYQKNKGDSIILHLDTNIQSSSNLFINDYKLKFDDITEYDPNELELFDSVGEVEFQMENRFESSFKIQPNRELKGQLTDAYGKIYQFRKEKKKGTEGFWILLNEPEKKHIDDSDMEVGVLNTFFDLLESGDFEIWERPDMWGRDTEGKIRVLRVEREDERILVERLPEKKIIYPPKNTSQLKKQLDAVESLRWRPAPEHRNLLKLFEVVERVNWEHPNKDFSESSIAWEFLKEREREGTSEQRNFVLKAMNSPDFTLLEGPPGSGKTTAITELIYQLVKRNKRILLCASTHVAIDNVLEKLIEKYGNHEGVMDNSIVPLRIGSDEQKVAELIQKFHIDKRKDKFEKIIQSETWFQCLSDKEKSDVIDEFVINSSNLVCGTTIGILQYPHFKKTAREYTKPEFDYLIIDEASKTTFQEFLVPAIHAKHWILVGDIRQLSPSVDTLNLRMNLDGILDSMAREKALMLYLKFIFDGINGNQKKKPSPKFIYVDEKEVISTIYTIFTKKLTVDKLRKTNISNKNQKIAVVANNVKHLEGSEITLLSSNEIKHFENAFPLLLNTNLIFVESSIYNNTRTFFPEDHIVIYPNNPHHPDVMDFRHRSYWDWIKDKGGGLYDYKVYRNEWTSNLLKIREEILKTAKKPWSSELAWRMNRVYELSNSIGAKNDDESPNRYLASMHALLPPDDDEHKNVWKEIKRLSRVAFPSILTSIQEGVSKFNRPDDQKTVISSGLPESVKEERYEELTYQHRMHPDISSIPRDVFYHGKKLRDVKSIIEGERSWNTNEDDIYDSRFYWKDVISKDIKNVNIHEIDIILKELDKVINWLKKTKKRNDSTPWSIMIISFYDAQRKEIRNRIQDTYEGNKNKQSRFIIDDVPVFNYTVDKVQGREADIVFLSLVRNDNIGFMDNPNRINVAITRAKYQLVIFGNREFFSSYRSCEEWRQVSSRAIPKFHRKKHRSGR